MKKTLQSLVILGLGASLLGGCQALQDKANETFGTNFDFTPMTATEEKALGDESAPEYVDAYGGEIASPQLQAYVNGIGQNLGRRSTRRDLIWRFHAVNSPGISHFSLPGGHVFVTRGLLYELQNEAQLAAVLSHEIAHVEAGHLKKRIDEEDKKGGVTKSLGGTETTAAYKGLMDGALGLKGGKMSLRFTEAEERVVSARALELLKETNYKVLSLVQASAIIASNEGVKTVDAIAVHDMTEDCRDHIKSTINASYDIRMGENRSGPYDQNVISVLETLP